MATIEDRVTALEDAFTGVQTALQDQTAEISRAGAVQLDAIREQGAKTTESLGDVNAAVVKIANGLLTLQQQVTKWAAAGSLAGAVVLFIAVRALGF